MSATVTATRPPNPGAVSAVLAEVVILVRDTAVVFWRLLPQILTIWLLGWLGSALALKLAVIVADVNAWAALLIFSVSFLSTLVAIVLILRLCGVELGIRQLIPDSEATADDRDSSLTRLLAVTLLPFLGLYAAFGQVTQQAARLSTEQVFRDPLSLGRPSVLQTVQGLASAHPGRLLALLAAIYLLRRGVDLAHDKSGWRPLGLLVAMIEGFFILAVIFGGFRLVRRLTRWFATREFVAWGSAVGRELRQLLAAVNLKLPAALTRLAGFVADDLVPLLVTVLGQPIIWLAVAALVYGSKVLSLAELWRRGRPVVQRIPGASVFDRYADKQALHVPPRVGAGRAGTRRVGREVREAFFGDIDDMYLPTFHSVRLVLRAGVGFLGAYVLVYGAVLMAQNYVQALYQAVVGGREISFWYITGPIFDLVENLPWEPLRLCLLAVAFRRCLELFRHQGGAPDPVKVVTADSPAGAAEVVMADDRPPPPPPRAPTPGSTARRRGHLRTVPRSKVVAAVTAIVLVALAGIGYQFSDAAVGEDQVVRGRLGEFSAYGSGTAQVSDVRVGTTLSSRSDTVATTGMFVVVRVTVRAPGRDDLTASNLELLAEGATYEPAIDTGRVTADPGFESARDIAFEVDPNRVANLTLEFWSTRGFVQGYAEHVRVPIGITSGNAAEWRQAAQGVQLPLATVPTTRGLR